MLHLCYATFYCALVYSPEFGAEYGGERTPVPNVIHHRSVGVIKSQDYGQTQSTALICLKVPTTL